MAWNVCEITRFCFFVFAVRGYNDDHDDDVEDDNTHTHMRKCNFFIDNRVIDVLITQLSYIIQAIARTIFNGYIT